MSTLTKSSSNRGGLWQNPIDRFFRNDFMDLLSKDVQLTVPSINISEGKNNYKIEMAAPGLKKDDINIDVDGGMITISCEKESESTNGNGKNSDNENTYTRREYNYSSFSRSFTIPDNANTEKMSAKYSDGILHLTIPKMQETERNKKQKIKID
jgi:HSP20 family protein